MICRIYMTVSGYRALATSIPTTIKTSHKCPKGNLFRILHTCNSISGIYVAVSGYSAITTPNTSSQKCLKGSLFICVICHTTRIPDKN